MKKIALYLIFAFGAIVATAQTRFDVDGLTYEILSESDRTVEVHDGSNASGELSIPETVSYNGVNYTVTTIGESAFESCSSLTTVTIPNSVTTISKGAFINCDRLIMINVDSKNNYYKSIDGVLFNSDATTLIQYPKGNSRTFYTIPNSVISICGDAFFLCNNLVTVTIPNSVTSIGDFAFSSCSGLTTVAIPNSVTSIGDYAFLLCSSLTTVTIPNSVTTIGNSAFESCSSLTTMTIPNSVTSIGSYVFFLCSSLTTVTIPNSVTSIGDFAFYVCHRLQEVTNFAKEPQQIASSVFEFVDLSSVRLIVPSSSVEKYKSADVWKEFGTIEGQEAGVGVVETDKIVVSGGVLRNPEGEEMRIYDLNGREMYSGNGSELRLPAGFYILQTSNGNRKVVF